LGSKATAQPGADAELGGFGGFFDPRAAGYTDPLLVAANDGVGTKVRSAIDHDRQLTRSASIWSPCASTI
jgi:phosphoribosylformylglycinamidine cyclo-ligase